MPQEFLDRLVSDPQVRRAIAKTLKGFCATYLAHHFPLTPSDFFDEMAGALQDHDIKRLEIIGFRGCAKSTWPRSPLSSGPRLNIPTSIRSSSCSRTPAGRPASMLRRVQHELRKNELILRDYGHLKYSNRRSSPRADAGERRGLAGYELRPRQWCAYTLPLARTEGARPQTPPTPSVAYRGRRRGGFGLGANTGEQRQERPLVSRQRAAVSG